MLAVHLHHGVMLRSWFSKTFLPLFTPPVTLQLPRETHLSQRYIPSLLICYWHILTLLKTNSRIMSFRNTITRWALESVQAYMGCFNVHKAKAYIMLAFSYHGEVPFLYRKFQLTDDAEPDCTKEPGGFKVVHSSALSSIGSHHLPINRSVIDFFGIKLSSRQC